MNLRERLRLMRPAGKPAVVEAPSLPHLPASPPSHVEAPTTTDTASLGGVISGRLVPTPAGDAFCIEYSYPVGFRRGSVSLGAALEVPRQGWTRLLRSDTSNGFSAASAAFVDTETTGLERGAGTYAFLIGVGRFTGDAFRVRQFFMRDYDEEPAVLQAVLAELEGASGLVTFNGRTFDWPLLQTRAILNRLPVLELPHLDVLHPARRLWRPVTENCRLVQLEEDVLGLSRQGDVPGHLIPQLYFAFVQTGDAAPLAGVISHNRLDILSTAALAGYLGLAAAEPLRAAPAGRPLPGSDLYAVARLLLEQDALDEGIACLEEALSRGLPAELRSGCRRLLGTVYRRAERYERAAEIWHALTNETQSSVFPHIQLAKHYEHRARDLEAARTWTLRAIEVLQRRRLLRGLGTKPTVGSEEGRDQEMGDLMLRLQRLEAKMARQAAGRRGRAGCHDRARAAAQLPWW